MNPVLRGVAAALLAAALLAASALSAPLAARAEEEKKPAIEFSRIQAECVRTDAVPFGPGGRWTSCRLTGAGFVGTIGLLDFYYASYCLVARGERCDGTALMLFANRAYRPEATLQFHRVDPAGTRYDHAQMVGSFGQHAIAVTVRRPGRGALERRFLAWDEPRWVAIDRAQWREALAAGLAARLPEGLRAVLPAEVMPAPERMAIDVPLRRARDGAPAGKAEVAVRVEGARFALGDVQLPAPTR